MSVATETGLVDPDGLVELPPIAIVVRMLRLTRGFTQAQLARELLGKNDAGYVSRLESGKERPELKKLVEIEYAFAKLGEPLDPFEVRTLEAAAIANWNWPSWAERPEERARVSEIRRDVTELVMRAYRAARERRSELVREDEVARESYLLK